MIPSTELPEYQKRWAKIDKVLRRLFPRAEIALKYRTQWQLAVAVRLSAQCTDKKVNEITPALFKKYRTLDDYVRAGRTAAGVHAFEAMIKPTGFYHSKARDILAAARYLQERCGGKLPRTMAEMVKVPGVGRKSANVILGNAYGVVEGIAVDTHVMRLSRVFGLTREKTPEKIERDLMAIIPRKDWFGATYRIIEYGRKYCPARPHQHAECPVEKALH